MTSFSQQVYSIVKTIPRGKVMTYGQMAKLLGRPKSARAVGNILHRNPDFKNIPCHRVVNRNGELSLKYAFGGKSIQKAKLMKEGIVFRNKSCILPKYIIQNSK